MSRRPLRAVLVALIVLVVVAGPTALIVMRSTRGSAAFGDTESIGRNRVASATLDIEVGARTVPIRAEGLAPGDVVTGAIELVNAGTIPLRYVIGVTGTTTNGLGAWLTWSFAPSGDGTCPGAAAWGTDAPADQVVVAGERFTSGASVTLLEDRVLEVGAAEVLCVAADFELGAPNAVQATTTEVVFEVRAEQLVAGERA